MLHRILIPLTAAAAVGGCALGYDTDRLRQTETGGASFTQSLAREYRDLSVFEADEMVDWESADYFAGKGLAAAAGNAVPPEPVGERRLSDAQAGELASARGRLVALLDANARTKAPEDAAIAQARFDCWIEQQEEGHQSEDIARCRDEFFGALERLDSIMAAAPAPAAEPAPQAAAAPPPSVRPQAYVLFFDFDSEEITAEAIAVIDEALAAARAAGFTEFSVTGHADRAGAADYNLALSLRRADAVRAAMAARGADPDGIFVAGRGEAEPAMPTADGVRDQANRRVEIIPQ
ncbi:OmpA family protein [Pelagibius sp.]|uniref:OmpA family protein n=1 Tax=Pelagibius sp. TaxID=1931238 RepID=UPI002613C5B0|nr:OmpA family protein [Pelagibius sp.]